MRIILVLVATLLLVSCAKQEQHRTESPVRPMPVAVQARAVDLQEWPTLYEAPGTVKARTSGTVSSKVTGYVRQVNVQIGDHVREGQVLATVDSRDLEANVRRAEAGRAEIDSTVPEADAAVSAAKASLDLTQATFQRMEQLAAKKSISRQEMDEATARLKGAQAQLEIARAKRRQLDYRRTQADSEVHSVSIIRDYATITAPFSGVITAKSVEPGNLASPGAPLFTIERDGSFRLEAAVEESRAASVRLGQTVKVRLDAIDRDLQGRIAEIVPAVDAGSRTYTVKIDLPPAAGLRSGMFGRAMLGAGVHKVLAAPAAALRDRGQLQSVFVVEDGSARIRLVAAGGRNNNYVELLSGVNPGEKIVCPIPAGLQDGARVEVRE